MIKNWCVIVCNVLIVFGSMFDISFASNVSKGDMPTKDTFSVYSMAEARQTRYIPLDNTYVMDENIYPFTLSGGKIYGLSLTADIRLEGDQSLVRVILVDSDSNQYLVYEAYPLLVDHTVFSVTRVCEETCLLDSITPASLKIQVIDGAMTLQGVSISEVVEKDVHLQRDQLRAAQSAAKIRMFNEQLRKKGKLWVAGETTISHLSYTEKAHLFGETAPLNLQGFEYYAGGIFDLLPSQQSASPFLTTLAPSALLVDSFDWRNRHGTNWLSAVKHQGSCGSCWAFGTTGAVEALANLHFNQHLDLDLAEQHLISCTAGGCSGGMRGMALDYYQTTGVVDEACFPYSATEGSCGNICSTPAEHIRISSYALIGTSGHPQSEESLKRAIIEYGPVSGGLNHWPHAMTLVGYGRIRSGDRVFTDGPFDPAIEIPAGHSLLGKTYWIFKNSWGTGWGDHGYGYIVTGLKNISAERLMGPVISSTPRDIQCVDEDLDTYCSWGISGAQPASCPASCQAQKDCDDSNPYIGPFDSQYHCTLIGSSILVIQNTTPIPLGSVYDFGDVSPGANKTAAFTIKNAGTENLHLTGSPLVSIYGGPDAGAFQVTQQPSETLLAPGETTSVEITLTPTVGKVTAAVSVPNSYLPQSSYYFTIHGGIPAIYVKHDAAGVNDGSSWNDAYTDLQSALAVAASGSHIWVAAGTYRPTTGTDRSATFSLPAGVSLYGGFAGTEISLDQRERDANETILSGGIGTEGDLSDNSFHVVTTLNTDAATLLDGVTITAGNAGSSGGGGLYNKDGDLTLRHVRFYGNSALYGAGMLNSGPPAVSHITLEHVTFIENSGGGLSNAGTAVLDHVTFRDNSTLSDGGGLNNSGQAALTYVLFSGNSAANGGGMYCNGSSPVTLDHVIFAGNTASSGGGAVYSAIIQSIAVTNSILWNNSPNQIKDVLTATTVKYSCVQENWSGTGNISDDPRFVDAADGNYHLKSQAGHWTPAGWVADTVTSPCIDAGEPAGAYNVEPSPHGGRVNIGLYGNTYEASRTYAPEMNITQNGNDIINGTGSFDFGSVDMGQNSTISFTVENTGTANLTLDAVPPDLVDISGADAGDFRVTAQPSPSIMPGSFTTFVLRFTPRRVGIHQAYVSILNNDADKTPYTFTVTGTGQEVSYLLWTQNGP